MINPTARAIVDACSYAHEDVHHRDLGCPEQGVARPGTNGPVERAECHALRAQMRCIESFRLNCRDAACHGALDGELAAVQELRDQNCKSSGNPPERTEQPSRALPPSDEPPPAPVRYLR